MVSLITGLREYDQALLARFGSAAIPTDVDLQQAIQKLADEPVMRFEGGVVKQGPDTAEVDPALNGVRLAGRLPIYLRLDKAVWKVDLIALRSDPNHEPALVRQYLAAGSALHQAAQDVRTGRYKTLDAALNSMGK